MRATTFLLTRNTLPYTNWSKWPMSQLLVKWYSSTSHQSAIWRVSDRQPPPWTCSSAVAYTLQYTAWWNMFETCSLVLPSVLIYFHIKVCSVLTIVLTWASHLCCSGRREFHFAWKMCPTLYGLPSTLFNENETNFIFLKNSLFVTATQRQQCLWLVLG